MGRTSKFSFPIPGRKRSSSKEQTYQAPPPMPKTGGLSKAEQILGTGTGEPVEWRRPTSRSSRISISISESTQSTRSMHDNGGGYDQWDGESGVLPRHTGVRGKASSNALGRSFGEDMATETSSTTHRLRNEDSTSTLKSYYDRQKLPPAISQQTSASSARDMALRKGLSPIVNRSPLLQVDSLDPWDQAGQNLSNTNDNHLGSPERKKSVRLGISSLFHRPERRPSNVSQNSYDSSKQSASIRNRLTKATSKESLQSQRPSILSTKSRDQRDQMQNQPPPQNSYDHYEQYEQSTRNAQMGSIPESNVPEQFTLFPSTSENGSRRQPGSINSEKREGHRRLEDLHSSPATESFSWKNVRSNTNGNFRNSMISQSTGHSSLGISSCGSISSHNTKTSRQTGGSVFSSADLQQSSVLSLSSDSEEDLSDSEPSKSRDNISIGKAPSYAESEIISPALVNRLSVGKNSTRRPSALKSSSSSRKASGTPQSSAFLTIPQSNGGLSKFPMPPSITRQDSVKSQESRPASSHRSRKTSISSTSKRSIHQQPTPPLSPKEIDDEVPVRMTKSGRLMQVTKQEEALLEALRQKRARMREKILEEHRNEGGKEPLRDGDRKESRFSKASTTSTIKPGQERVPLYLDAPILKGRGEEYTDDNKQGMGMHGQPSPDLSDFLSMGSEYFGEDVEGEDEETPTNSRGVSRMEVRGVLEVQPDPRFFSGMKGEGQGKNKGNGHKKRNPSVGKVRFVGEEEEEERVWGM